MRGRRSDRTVRLLADLLPLNAGEKLIEHYCEDITGCDCPPTHVRAVECKPVARVGGGRRLYPEDPRLPGVDRCLQCGARWERRDYRTDPLVVIAATEAA